MLKVMTSGHGGVAVHATGEITERHQVQTLGVQALPHLQQQSPISNYTNRMVPFASILDSANSECRMTK